MPTGIVGHPLFILGYFGGFLCFLILDLYLGLLVVIQLFTGLETLLTFLSFLTDLSHLEASKTDLVCVCSAPTITNSVMLFGH